MHCQLINPVQRNQSVVTKTRAHHSAELRTEHLYRSVAHGGTSCIPPPRMLHKDNRVLLLISQLLRLSQFQRSVRAGRATVRNVAGNPTGSLTFSINST